jgi:hypothetical protein
MLNICYIPKQESNNITKKCYEPTKGKSNEKTDMYSSVNRPHAFLVRLHEKKSIVKRYDRAGKDLGYR